MSDPMQERDWYCRTCYHITKPVGEIESCVCAHCGSQNIGLASDSLEKRRAMGWITEPEDKPPTKHQRLKEGFALLREAEL